MLIKNSLHSQGKNRQGKTEKSVDLTDPARSTKMVFQFNGLKKWVTAWVEARGPGRNAPEASVGLTFGNENPSVFPPKEAGGVFPAPSTQKSAPHESKRAARPPGLGCPWAVTPQLSSKRYSVVLVLNL
jgi:hypothetical protein